MVPRAITHGALKSEEEHRHDICAVGAWIHKRGFTAATDGNVSVRLDENRILTSPTCMSKGMMSPDDLVITDRSGRQLSGTRNASSELGMHLLIYRLRPDINAVCHAHPPVATGYAAASLPLDQPILCELVIGLGRIPVARYGTPGTSELTEALAPLVPGHDAILMANHGVVTYGPDLLTAFQHMETTEHFARVALVTGLLGKRTLLSDTDVEKLEAARARYFTGTQAPSAAKSDDGDSDRIELTRRELDALIEEALQRDRARR